MTKYTMTGLWMEERDGVVRIGLSEKGQDDVGEVMFVELPEFGEILKIGDDLLSVEGAKAVSEFSAPINCTFTKVHSELLDEMEKLNSTDREDNWIIELQNVSGFISAEFSTDPWFGQTKPKSEPETEEV